MSLSQRDLFEAPAAGPAGLRYQTDFLPAQQERALVRRFAELSFKPFEFHQYLGKRRIVSFGWRYDFAGHQVREAEAIPDDLAALRAAAAGFAGLPAEEFRQVMVTEYEPGAGIGWHRDKAEFGEVIGVSLAAACNLRFRRRRGSGWERYSLAAEPRSIYLLQGDSRSAWQHSIPAVAALRYSVTFRRYRVGSPEAGAVPG